MVYIANRSHDLLLRFCSREGKRIRTKIALFRSLEVYVTFFLGRGGGEGEGKILGRKKERYDIYHCYFSRLVSDNLSFLTTTREVV